MPKESEKRSIRTGYPYTYVVKTFIKTHVNYSANLNDPATIASPRGPAGKGDGRRPVIGRYFGDRRRRRGGGAGDSGGKDDNNNNYYYYRYNPQGWASAYYIDYGSTVVVVIVAPCSIQGVHRQRNNVLQHQSTSDVRMVHCVYIIYNVRPRGGGEIN